VVTESVQTIQAAQLVEPHEFWSDVKVLTLQTPNGDTDAVETLEPTLAMERG